MNSSSHDELLMLVLDRFVIEIIILITEKGISAKKLELGNFWCFWMTNDFNSSLQLTFCRSNNQSIINSSFQQYIYKLF